MLFSSPRGILICASISDYMEFVLSRNTGGVPFGSVSEYCEVDSIVFRGLDWRTLDDL
jgi:hypothetical protein